MVLMEKTLQSVVNYVVMIYKTVVGSCFYATNRCKCIFKYFFLCVGRTGSLCLAHQCILYSDSADVVRDDLLIYPVVTKQASPLLLTEPQILATETHWNIILE